MHKLILVVLAIGGAQALAAAQDPATKQALEQLTKRVDELEEQQLKTADRVGGRALLQAYTAQSLDLGGQLTSVFASMLGRGSTETGHLVSFVELYLKAGIDDHWSVFATPGFYVFNGGLVDDPITTTITGDPLYLPDESGEARTILSRAFGEYAHSDALHVQGGIVGSPHGLVNREYLIPSRVIAAGNLHTRYFQENQLYPQQLLGARALGKLPAGDSSLFEYDVYFGAEDDSPTDALYGARLAWQPGELGLTVAANYGRGTREGFPPEPLTATFPLFTGNVPFLQAPFNGRYNLTRDYQFGGVDVELRAGPVVSRTEAYYSAEDDVEDQRAFSSELNWFVVDELIASYRFDYHDAGEDLDAFGIAVGELGHATEHAVGVCYTPHSGVRLRLDFHHLLLPNTDETIDFFNLSWSLSF